jgi:group I intron endonuclease
MTVTSVYWIRCADHTDLMTQGYVGVSGRFNRRMWEHLHSKQNPHLQRAIQKHGWDNLVKTQILIADEDYCLDIERKLRPSEKIGWNLVRGGGKPPVLYGNTSRIGKPSPRKGKKHTPATIARMRLVKLGKESGMKGKKHSEATLQKVKATYAANPWTCPHCSKIGLNKGTGTRWHFDNCKEKTSCLS